MPTYYIQKTLTTDGNTFGFSGLNVQLSLDSEVTKVMEIMEKKYAAKVNRPFSTVNQATNTATTILIDVKQIQWTFTVMGVLTNDTGNISALVPDTPATAINKKKLLQAMCEQGGTVTFGHRNNTTAETVGIITLSFEDTNCDVGSDETTFMKENEMRIAFTMVLQKGTDRT